MKLLFLSFYFPPDLCAGSFRAESICKALKNAADTDDQILVITTHPNRYASYTTEAPDDFTDDNVHVHRIRIPSHSSGMIAQSRAFLVFAWYAYKYAIDFKPTYILGTTSRLMTGILTWICAKRSRVPYFIDLRDIFSETISDVFRRKSIVLSNLFQIVFSRIERHILRNAIGVNVVSEGFPPYFQQLGLDTKKWTFFPNGIDQEFIKSRKLQKSTELNNKVILYAGNIGAGQGLDIIIPQLANKVPTEYIIRIIGDGGARKALEHRLLEQGIRNVDIVDPVERDKLVEYYNEASVLFLHLNELPAFKRVLPSKIFEYAAAGKPILAGLEGYSADFINNNISYACVFKPGDSNQCIACLSKFDNIVIDENEVHSFINRFTRANITKAFVQHILQLQNNSYEKQT